MGSRKHPLLKSTERATTMHPNTSQAPEVKMMGWVGFRDWATLTLKPQNKKVSSFVKSGVRASKKSHYFYMNDNV